MTGMITVTCNQLTKLLDRDILFYRIQDDGLAAPQLFAVNSGENVSDYVDDNERAVASWVYHNNKRAGATTGTLGNAKCLYLSVRLAQEVFRRCGDCDRRQTAGRI